MDDPFKAKANMRRVYSLKELRQALDMTQQEISRKVGCSLSGYSLWERGSSKMTKRFREKFWVLALSYRIEIKETDFLRDYIIKQQIKRDAEKMLEGIVLIDKEYDQ